jgi:hypothetical protein
MQNTSRAARSQGIAGLKRLLRKVEIASDGSPELDSEFANIFPSAPAPLGGRGFWGCRRLHAVKQFRSALEEIRCGLRRMSSFAVFRRDARRQGDVSDAGRIC